MTVGENVAWARERIATACERSRRLPSSVRLCAVSKTFPPDAIQRAIEAGVDAIGENRVQEAASKRPAIGGTTPWHLVGPLQRNKAGQALELFDLLETLDRPELADRLQRLLVGSTRTLPILIEVNVGSEAQKHGVEATGAPALLDHVLERCPRLLPLGFMTVPPLDEDAERSRRYFAELRVLAERLWAARGLGPPELSMGMSGDFEVAVEEGATWVRLGRVLFGSRSVGT
jgi:pyridoxal phosphate enzyme (YggS family)